MQPKIQSARHTCTWGMELSVSSVADELGHAPVLEAAVWEITSDDKWDFTLGQLFNGDLKGVRFAVQWDEHRRVHTENRSTWFRTHETEAATTVALHT